jgi:RNA polymerase sigma-70 factor (ECF subfamily)
MTGPGNVTDRMTDEELVAAFTGGSEEAFTILVGKYKNPLVNFVCRILRDYEASLDVVQDTFVRLHEKAHTYRPVAKFSTWIYTIASNLAKTELRRRRGGIFGRRAEAQSGSATAEVPDPGEPPDGLADRAIAARKVERALSSLPDAFREAVVLFYIEDMGYEEICRILGIRMGTLKSRLSRARAILAGELRPLLEPDETD